MIDKILIELTPLLTLAIVQRNELDVVPERASSGLRAIGCPTPVLREQCGTFHENNLILGDVKYCFYRHMPPQGYRVLSLRAPLPSNPCLKRTEWEAIQSLV